MKTLEQHPKIISKTILMNKRSQMFFRIDYVWGYVIKICVLSVAHVCGQKNRSAADKKNLNKFIFNRSDIKK